VAERESGRARRSRVLRASILEALRASRDPEVRRFVLANLAAQGLEWPREVREEPAHATNSSHPTQLAVSADAMIGAMHAEGC